MIAKYRIKYLEECKKLARAKGVQKSSMGISFIVVGHPKSEDKCGAYVENQLKRDAEYRANRRAKQKSRQYQQATPSTRNYSGRQEAYEYRNYHFYQNVSPNMRPERYR